MIRFYTATAALSLAACLAAPVLRFMNLLSDRDFQVSFLLASLAWFIAAAVRVSRKPR